jgi:hypothetical protein
VNYRGGLIGRVGPPEEYVGGLVGEGQLILAVGPVEDDVSRVVEGAVTLGLPSSQVTTSVLEAPWITIISPTFMLGYMLPDSTATMGVQTPRVT